MSQFDGNRAGLTVLRIVLGSACSLSRSAIQSAPGVYYDSSMSSNRSYRERALKILPWVCARCGREFTGKKLRQLDVFPLAPDLGSNCDGFDNFRKCLHPIV